MVTLLGRGDRIVCRGGNWFRINIVKQKGLWDGWSLFVAVYVMNLNLFRVSRQEWYLENKFKPKKLKIIIFSLGGRLTPALSQSYSLVTYMFDPGSFAHFLLRFFFDYSMLK